MSQQLLPTAPNTNNSLWDLTFKLCRAVFRGQGLIGSGSNYIANTTPVTGGWFAIQALEDTVFSTLTSDVTNLPNTLALSSGQVIFGNFTAVTLTSGRVICYAK